ncbi:TPA: tail assembly protein, partial [Mannheimia haemolytica]|nr:tail assembly protein [Mannheimia haemolytica]HDL1756071.1 tail assembly protein [Mannheimia haemolytica]HDL2159260.1 tail assembly protein [Mannheimia haemolytica]HDL2161615.1 tail assembly protein [Mannheimia haemolytica]
MITVKFYGHLKTFGTDFKILVKDIAEAIRALCSQLKGLREALRDGVYKVRIGKQYLDPSALEKGLFYCLKKGQ